MLKKQDSYKFTFKKKYDSERAFQSDFLKSLRLKWYRARKFSDTWYELKPFDIVAVWDWVPMAIELKYWKVNSYELIYKMLRPNQIGWLKHFQDAWWKSYIVWRDKFEWKIYSYEYKYLWSNKRSL